MHSKPTHADRQLLSESLTDVITSLSLPSVAGMITYTNYRNIFPIWALGRYVQWCKVRQ